ncbi:MAG: zinc ABC transporter substrate-binding protein, partial [Gammaproteobacteria bacterium]
MKHHMQSWFLLTVLLLVAAPTTAAEKMVIYTVNYPLQYFAERIGGQHVDVHFPAPKGVDPAFWKPDVKTIGQYQQADLILLNGANYAKWINQVSLPRLRTVDTSRGFGDQLIKVSAGATHSHGPSGDHSHSGTAFTTWLDPQLASLQAKAIRDALIK